MNSEIILTILGVVVSLIAYFFQLEYLYVLAILLFFFSYINFE